MNENTQLIKRLQAAKLAIDQLLTNLGDCAQEKGLLLKACPICGDPIYANDPMQRGVHKKCVGIGLARVKAGRLSHAEYEAALDPPARAGRKPKQLAIDAAAQRSIADAASADIDKKLKRLGATKQFRKKTSD